VARERSWGAIEWVILVLIIAAATVLVLGRQYIIASDNEEWAQAIDTYFSEARPIYDDFEEADRTIWVFIEATVAGDELTPDQVSEAKAALDSMDRSRAAWGQIPVPEELLGVHENIAEAMLLVQKGDVGFYEAYVAEYPRGIAAANIARREAAAQLEEAYAELEAWYAENEEHIERELR
jgi:hypothetical protein